MGKWISVMVFAFACVGCGRYLPPIAPEIMAPDGVDKLVITPSEQGVKFAWVAPERDRRGKELSNFSGYRIRRKELLERGDETNEKIPFEEVGFIPDTHIEVREKLRAEARAQGKIGRRVQAPKELTEFSFTDTSPVRNKTYLYKVVPENQGSVEGAVNELIKITYKGTGSDVTVINARALETPPAEQDQNLSEPS